MNELDKHQHAEEAIRRMVSDRDRARSVNFDGVMEDRPRLMPSYLEQMRAHVDEGGQLSHRNGLDLLAEVERLNVPAQQEPKPIGRQWIADLIREQFDPDGTDLSCWVIADSILANLPLLRAEGSATPSTSHSPESCGGGESRPAGYAKADTERGQNAARTAGVAAGPQGLCPGGFDPEWDECSKCGATADEACAFASTEGK